MRRRSPSRNSRNKYPSKRTLDDSERLHNSYVDSLARKYASFYREIRTNFEYVGPRFGEVDMMGILDEWGPGNRDKKIDIFEIKCNENAWALITAKDELERARNHFRGRGWTVLSCYVFFGGQKSMYGLTEEGVFKQVPFSEGGASYPASCAL